MWRGAMLCRYAVRVSIRCTNHHTCPCMAFVCYDTRTYTRGASWTTCTCRPGYIAIVVAIKYIVLEGVFYNGFLLFIKTEGLLQSAAVCFLTCVYRIMIGLSSLLYCLSIEFMQKNLLEESKKWIIYLYILRYILY